MKQFKDFNIKPAVKTLNGDKIKISRILNREIIIDDYRIEDSKYKKDNVRWNDKCLYLQVKVDGNAHVIFTGSNSLIEMIKQVPMSEFPFTTTIIKENERFEFS